MRSCADDMTTPMLSCILSHCCCCTVFIARRSITSLDAEKCLVQVAPAALYTRWRVARTRCTRECLLVGPASRTSALVPAGLAPACRSIVATSKRRPRSTVRPHVTSAVIKNRLFDVFTALYTEYLHKNTSRFWRTLKIFYSPYLVDNIK